MPLVLYPGNRLQELFPHLSAVPVEWDAPIAPCPGGPKAPLCWQPPVGVFETASALIVQAEVAGAREEDVRVLVLQDAVILEGQRTPDHHAILEPLFHRATIRYGPFRLVVPVPTRVSVEEAILRYERGFLLLMLPKTGEIVS